MRRALALACALTLAVAALLTLGRLARADQDETGPNFTLPEKTSPDIAQRYKDAVDAFHEAEKTEADAALKIEACKKKLLSLKKDAPELPQPRYWLGLLYQWTKEFQKARESLEGAIELNPKFHQAIIELGDVYGWLKMPDKALAQYDKAIALVPAYPHAYEMRGFAKLRAADCQGSIDDFTQAEKLGARDGFVEAYKAKAQQELASPDWTGTIYTATSDHYIVKTPVSQEVADWVDQRAELIYRTYTLMFPKIDKAKRKFQILCYANSEDYHKHGGPAQAGGHYDPIIRKLHIFKYDKDDDTLLVLQHEGFHQFIHDYLDDAPQWFNEGTADFFGPTAYEPTLGKNGKPIRESMRLRPNPWRLHTIQAAIKAGKIRTWKQLMLMSQRELYQADWAGIHYAESWSIIYFLIRGGAAPDQTTGPYFKLIDSYFNALRKGDGQEEAYEKAFGKVDVPALEKAWKAFIVQLPDD